MRHCGWDLRIGERTVDVTGYYKYVGALCCLRTGRVVSIEDHYHWRNVDGSLPKRVLIWACRKMYEQRMKDSVKEMVFY